MSKSLFFIALIAITLFASPSLQFGELDVDWILANDVAVQIEGALIADTTLILDFVEGLSDSGVFVEDINANDGSLFVPVDAHIEGTNTVQGTLFANGGILADSEFDGDISFHVADDTGDTTIKGLTHVLGGINADNGKFTVADNTGETRIASALLRPDGGINVNDGLFTVNPLDGSFRTESNANIYLDIFLGTAIAEERVIARVPASSDNGGNTIIKGQDATSLGGDLILTPGTGATIGKVILGRQEPDDLYIGRSSLDSSATDGGRTTFFGQDAQNGRGGDLVVAAGDSTSEGSGGNLVLSVGLSSSGLPGKILLGTDKQGFNDFDLFVTRPPLIGGVGGKTSFIGQSTKQGAGGDVWIQAGSVTAGAGLPGDLLLVPGSNSADVIGSIFLGGTSASDLNVERFPVSAPGGDTHINGQTSFSGDGGDLYLAAGHAGSNGRGGSIWLQPGSTPNGAVGSIFWGQAADDLEVVRPSSLSSGASTTLQGQDSSAGSGGDFNLVGGSGTTDGGDVTVSAGVGNSGVGGSVAFSAGSGSVFGGSIQITAGIGSSGDGGNVIIASGNGSNNGGDIIFNSGAGGNSNGDVVIASTARELTINSDVVINNSHISIENGNNVLDITADPNQVLAFNGVKILRSRIDSVQTVVTTNVVQTDIQNLQGAYQSLVNALGPAGHGLFNLVDATNFPVTVPAALP